MPMPDTQEVQARTVEDMSNEIAKAFARFRGEHMAELEKIPGMQGQLTALTTKQAEIMQITDRLQTLAQDGGAGPSVSPEERLSLAEVPTLKESISHLQAMMESINNAQAGSEEQMTRVKNLTDNYEILLHRVENTQKALDDLKFAESDDSMRVQLSGSHYDGMRLKKFGYKYIMAEFVKMDASERRHVNEVYGKMDAPTRDQIEAHYDALAKRRPLDLYTTWRRDELLGRNHSGKSLELINLTSKDARRLDAAITTAADSAGTAIATMIMDEFWQDVVMTEESVLSRLPAIAMLSNPYEIPLIGASAWNDVTAQLQTGVRTDGDARTFVSKMVTGDDFHGMEHISQRLLDDMGPAVDMEVERLLPLIMAEAIDRAIIMADTNTTAAQNVNGVAYNGAATGRIPELIGWNGLMKGAHANAEYSTQAGANGSSAGALSSTNASGALNRLRNLLGRAALRPGSWLFITPMKERQAIRDNVAAYQRLDAVGVLSTLVGGDLPIYMSGEIISPEGMPQAFANNGKISGTPANNTLGAMLAISPELCWVGNRVAPMAYMQGPAGDDPMGVWLHMRARTGFTMRGYNSEDGTFATAAYRPDRAPVGLSYNITR